MNLYSSPNNVEPSDNKFANSGISLHLAIGKEAYLSGWDRSATGDWHSILRLSAKQAKDAKALLQNLRENPEWIGPKFYIGSVFARKRQTSNARKWQAHLSISTRRELSESGLKT